MSITTRLAEQLGMRHPFVSAPMDAVAGGRLAGAASAAAGLGLLGGGYTEDADWFERAFAAAGNQSAGCGFITWALRPSPYVRDVVVARQPKAIFLSFEDPKPFSKSDRGDGVLSTANPSDAERAIDRGAEVIVPEGAEAGGHSGSHATLTLVSEIADLIAKRTPQGLLHAAGGIVDGLGLAAALMLGAGGDVVGSRFWASRMSSVGAGQRYLPTGMRHGAARYGGPSPLQLSAN